MSEVVHESNYDSLLDAFSPLKNRLNWLLLAVPVTLFFNIQGNVEMTFLFSMISIMPLAFLMGHATEEIALRAGENLGVYSMPHSETLWKLSLQALPSTQRLAIQIKQRR